MSTDLDLEVAPVRPGDFRHRAGCRDVDPELFFPTAETGPLYAAQVTAAKAVCAGCPVRAECLTWALQTLPDGVAGGLTAQERRRLRRTPRASSELAVAGAVAEADVDVDEVDPVVDPVMVERLTRHGHQDDATRTELAAAAVLLVRRERLSVNATSLRLRIGHREVRRWATGCGTAGASSTGPPDPSRGRGAPAATGLPSGSPNSTNPQAGTGTVEGHRS